MCTWPRNVCRALQKRKTEGRNRKRRKRRTRKKRTRNKSLCVLTYLSFVFVCFFTTSGEPDWRPLKVHSFYSFQIVLQTSKSWKCVLRLEQASQLQPFLVLPSYTTQVGCQKWLDNGNKQIVWARLWKKINNANSNKISSLTKNYTFTLWRQHTHTPLYELLSWIHSHWSTANEL